MVHVDSRRTEMITMLIFATAVAVSTLVIITYDRPFGGGGVSVSPTALEQAKPD